MGIAATNIAVMPIASHPAGSLSSGSSCSPSESCDKPLTADIHSDCKWQILEFPYWMMYDIGCQAGKLQTGWKHRNPEDHRSSLKGVSFKGAQTVYIGPSTPISASLYKHTKTHPADHGIRSVMLQNHQVCRTSVWPQVSAWHAVWNAVFNPMFFGTKQNPRQLNHTGQ